MARRARPLLPPAEVAAILRAIGDPRRYDIVRELAAAEGAVPCCTLAQADQVGAPTLSHHLGQLEQAGLVEIARDGKFAVLRFRRDRFALFLRQLAADGRVCLLPDAARIGTD